MAYYPPFHSRISKKTRKDHTVWISYSIQIGYIFFSFVESLKCHHTGLRHRGAFTNVVLSGLLVVVWQIPEHRWHFPLQLPWVTLYQLSCSPILLSTGAAIPSAAFHSRRNAVKRSPNRAHISMVLWSGEYIWSQLLGSTDLFQFFQPVYFYISSLVPACF